MTKTCPHIVDDRDRHPKSANRGNRANVSAFRESSAYRAFSAVDVDEFVVGSFISESERGTQVFDQQHEVEFKAGAAFETIFAIKGCGCGVNRANQNGAAADDLCAGVCALQGVFQEARAKAVPLLSFVHR